MVEWSAAEGCVCGYGETGRVSLEADGWDPGGTAPPVGAAVDTVAVGRTRGLRLPAAPTRADGRPVGEGELDEGVHRFRVGTTPAVRLAFEGPAALEAADAGTWLRFPEDRAVAVGFRESPPPRPRLSVPATPAGLATAVTAAAGTHRTAGPERSHPGYRPRTPAVTLGERAVPDELTDDRDTEMVVPESTPAVLVAAPLAYYLGADLSVGEGPPRLRGPGLDRTFDPMPALADGVARALRRVVWLDTRLRSLPGETGRLPGVTEADRLASAPPTERLRAALEGRPPEPRPAWPLSTYVDDDVRYGRYLPYLLDRLSLVHPASASALDPEALLKRSLEEFYRGTPPDIDAVDPALSESRHHAWLAEGTPVDAYTLAGDPTPAPGDSEDIDVEVVCNDPEMAEERAVADVYRERLAGRGASVRVRERLSRADLAAVFEGSADLVHFVGHCDVDGLVCPDGTLAAAAIEGCGVEAFVLNACGSYYEGYELVGRGAVVGAVTLSSVLDEQAVTLGTALAGLLADGFSFARALSLARGEILVGQDYAVVGDGTHRLRPPAGVPGVFEVRPLEAGFEVRYDVLSPEDAGRRFVDPISGAELVRGAAPTATLDRAALADLLERVPAPVRFEGRLRRSGSLAVDIRRDGGGN